MKSASRILVVDDDPDIAEQIETTLRAEGYEVVVAGGQEEAEETLLSLKPDLAILDLMMEQHDSGFVLCHEIKRLYPGTPVIVLTSVKSATGISFDAFSEEQKSWIKAERFLDKPIRPEELRAEVSRLLAAAGAPGNAE